MKKIKKLMNMTLCLLLLTATLSVLCPVTANAASYKKLYKKFLEKGTVQAGDITLEAKWYYVVNVDRKGTPELILMSGGNGMVRYDVYTVKKGKVKYAGYYGARGVSGKQPTISYMKKYKGLVASGWTNGIGGAWNNMFTIKKNKLVQKKHLMSQNDGYYYGKTTETRHKISKKKFNKYYKKYFEKAKTYKMKQNTAANREKSFK